MKVAIDARLIGGTSTGDSTYWTCFLQSFVELYPEVELVFVSNLPRPMNVPFLEKSSWIVAPAKSSRWWSMVTLPLTARKIGANLVHGQYGISPLSRNGVSTIHDVSFMVDPSWFSSRDFSLLKLGVDMAAKKAKRLITVSETSRQEIEKFFPNAKGKTRVATNACPPWIHRSEESPGIGSDYVLTVGTNWARKNMMLAVNAMEQISQETGVKLVVTGKQGAEISASHVVATGYVDTEKLSALYSGAKMYLAPSFHEGFGIPIVEAMRCGTPVVCGPGGAMPEVAGLAALIMADYDVDTWQTAIRKLLGDPSKLSELSRLGKVREQEFTWARSAQAHYEVYREVTGQ